MQEELGGLSPGEWLTLYGIRALYERITENVATFLDQTLTPEELQQAAREREINRQILAVAIEQLGGRDNLPPTGLPEIDDLAREFFPSVKRQLEQMQRLMEV